jgi:hypothetical protein
MPLRLRCGRQLSGDMPMQSGQHAVDIRPVFGAFWGMMVGFPPSAELSKRRKNVEWVDKRSSLATLGAARPGERKIT